MTTTDFLLARIAEDEAEARALLQRAQDNERACKAPELLGRVIPGWHDWPKVQALATKAIADAEAKREIVLRHEAWPVLVQTEPEFDRSNTDRAFVSLRQYMVWLTEREYRSRFGIEPPTAPVIAALMATYADHPDCASAMSS